VAMLQSCSDFDNSNNLTGLNDESSASFRSSTPNILLIIADDLGKDALKGYSEGSLKANTPNIDALRNKGLLFDNLWANPTCTPTRSTIFTGKYGFSTGMKGVGDVLSSSETSLQQFISNKTNNSYATAIIGKWHLSGSNSGVNPESFGIDYYSGLISGAVNDYYQWTLTEDGATKQQTKYATEVFTDLAIDWVNAQTKPWFLWLAYNAPHTPFHVPPSNMHSQGNLPAYNNSMNPTPYYLAAIEAMDYQIGRFLSSIPADEKDNTVIIFMGDNGTPPQVIQSPYSSTKAKNTVYQGGVNVPLIIAGKGVTRIGKDNNLVSTSDLFSTIAELCGINLSQYNDSKSFKSLLTESKTIRANTYTEIQDETTDAWAIRNAQYKLIENISGNKEMYDLIVDPYENANILNRTLTNTEINAKVELESELRKIRKESIKIPTDEYSLVRLPYGGVGNTKILNRQNGITGPQELCLWLCGIPTNGAGNSNSKDWMNADGTWDYMRKPQVSGNVVWPNQLNISIVGSDRVITSNGLPSHPTGIYPITNATNPTAYKYDRNPNIISTKNYNYTLPANPQVASTATCVTYGPSGISLTGSVIYHGASTLGNDAAAHEMLDKFGGHTDGTSTYHYHFASQDLQNQIGINKGGHSPLMGYMFDGFGIYGPYGDDGKLIWSKDLDEYHGHKHPVMWDGKLVDIYHYHWTYDFPYNIGAFKGTKLY